MKRILIVLIMIAGSVFIANPALAAEGPVPVTKVTLCHEPAGNPANIHKITPSINSVVGNQGHIHDDLDIIPPFYYENGDGDVVLFPGLNWDAAGQAQFANPDCEAVVVVNPTSVPTEDPSAKAPTCLADGALVVPTTDHVVYTVSPVGQTGPGTYAVNAEPADADHVLTGETEWTIPVLPKLTGQELCPIVVVDDDPNDVSKITICHAPPGNIENIQLITVSVNSIVEGAGHDGHSDDIIPSFTYTDDNDQPATYPGKNYDASGQYLLDPAHEALDCQTALATPVEPSVDLVTGCGDTGLVSPENTTGVLYAFIPAGASPTSGVWSVIATPALGYHFDGVGFVVFDGDLGTSEGCSVNQDSVPSVAETPTCAGHTSVVPNPVTGVDYVFTIGDGITGPWKITASAQDGFVINGPSVFSGDAGVAADCPDIGDGDPGIEPIAETVTPDSVDPIGSAALPDTGGPSLGWLPFSGLLIVAGTVVLARRRTV